MIGLFRKICCVFLLSTRLFLSADELNVRIFRVGQANAVLLTKGNKALVVDCGNGSGYGACFNAINYVEEVKDALSEVTELKVIVTHNHKDHYEAITAFIKIVTNISTISVPVIWNTGYPFSTMEGIFLLQWWKYAGWINDKASVDAYLDNFFGDGVEVRCLRPDKFENTLLSPEQEHDNDVLLFISYAGKSILLPGDANGTLLAYHLLHTAGFIEDLKRVNIFLVPHHGSTRNGEQLWVDAIFNGRDDGAKLLFISSDPNKDDQIPRKWFWDQFNDGTKLPEFAYIGKTWERQTPCYRISIDNNRGEIKVYSGKRFIISAH